MQYLLIAFLTSLVLTALIVRFRTFGHILDSELDSVQKFHAKPVPRVGGVSLVGAMLAICMVAAFRETEELPELLLLLISAMPAFLGGLFEDLTKSVRVVTRLALAMASGALAYFLLGAAVVRVDIIGLDWLLQYSAISFFFTVFAIAGAANALNIIDGYNGLAAVVSAMIFAGFAYVCFYLGDRMLLIVALGMLGSVIGFLFWNYPRGHIFLGDGGAYFLGFMIGELSVLLLVRHPEVSAWFPLLLCIYPVFETLFSIYRKRWLRGHSPGAPDGVHLHMLIYKRVVRWVVGSREAHHLTWRNSLTSPYLWLLSSLGVIPAVLFWQMPVVLMVCVLAFAMGYVMLYRKLVLFRIPKWMIVKKKKHGR
ncbi:glycosyltransferase [Bordetella sp. 15P40C-2]|uniref:MraY family glycosyltransferase n=1 Tax=Bordetella sp. 15P40C-2 TaxID=2572246 RepID=UPI0013245506|nr:glycosyltransferase [Bordetella sp. 15P40C-2]MVW71369.1 glycosyl transferase [Bordetella sp. 15P40C-2]